jgi:glycosyltransferase involved in cell wall biosynthesis
MPERKKVFINASTVLFSGGLILSQSIIETLIHSNSFDIIITCPRTGPYQHFITNYSKIRKVPRCFLYRPLRWIHDYFWLPALIHHVGPDMVLTLGNLPARTSYKQIFLHDNPYLVEKSYDHIPLSTLQKIVHRLRCRLTMQRMRFVKLVLVQTEYQKQGLKLLINGDPPARIYTPFVPLVQNPGQPYSPPVVPTGKKFKILCLSRYYEHKNIEILVELAATIKSMNLPFIFYLTISRNHGEKAVRLIKSLKTREVEDVIINLGHSHHYYVPGIISQVDGIILPSLLESFSLSCIEAWQYGKPLFVSDLPSLRSSCHNAAFYFNPFSATDLLNCLNNAFSEPDNLLTKKKEGEKRLKELSQWSEYITLLNEF